ncbi:major facilitator superfamily domain-containing protein 6-like isoform X2 [Daphnia pulicaria]|uniref:major facilitator superfamily domain-containing protein 6-like isoform X2 n=1 Tax=Daphnia pulicaria TaxID=35523 RepID=UPI001EE9ED47|nr:major facilitator superfamily domain-containing protein 6-like isoform X2 [Daphnia pulicaria]
MDFEINKKLLPMKAHYFFFNAGLAPIMPFIPTYARQLGVSQVGVGLMYTVFPFVGLLAKPLFGTIADKFRIGKQIFITAIICAAIFFTSIYFIPAKPTEALMDFDCNLMTILKTCEVSDNCTLTRINLENPDMMSTLECTLICNNPNSQFLEEMCSTWNVSDVCNTNLTSIEMKTYSNMSKALLEESSCLYFPVENLSFNGTEVENPYCKSSTSMKCNTVCNSATVMSYIQKPITETSQEPYYSTIQFQMLFGLMIGAWASTAVVTSLADSICFNLLGSKPHDYGRQRLWGALGWGISAIFAGYLIDSVSHGENIKNYTPSFILVFIMLTVNTISVSKIKIDYRQEPYAFAKVASLFKDVKVVLFLLSCITFGICIGSIWQFLFWYLEDMASSQGCDSLEWIKLLEGLAMGIQCFAGEAPFLFLSGWFLNKLGHVHTMTMILLVMGFRLICYSLLTNPWLTLPIELLNGLTLGVYWSTMTSYAYLIAPPGAGTTLQGIFGALFEGIGTAVGSLLGGFIFQNYGGAIMYRSFGIYTLIFGILYSSIHAFMDRKKTMTRKESYSRVNQAPDDQL